MLYVVVEELIPEMSEGPHSNIWNADLRPGIYRHDDSGCCLGLTFSTSTGAVFGSGACAFLRLMLC